MLKAVIFDFDGVIADSEPLHYRAFKEIVSRYGVNLTEKRYYDEYLGYTDIECTRAISADFDLGLNEDQINRLMQEKTELFEHFVQAESTIIDGAREFLGMLKQEDVRLAVCSGALLEDIELMLDGTDLKGMFEIIVAADHVQKGKPDPEGFLLTLQRLNKSGTEQIKTCECVVIEDSPWGLKAAASARMHTIAVTNSYSAEQLSGLAQKVVDQLDELTISDLQSVCAQREASY